MRPTTRRTHRLTALVAAGAMTLLAACGPDANAGGDGVLTVTMTDFSYGDLPAEVPAGTRIDVVNDSSTELHELVAIRLPDGDDRPVDELLGDLEGVMSAGPPAAVLLAAPDGEPIAAVGDGTLTEPGRYLILCAIPTGADPAEYLAAAAESDGPPQVAGGAPHFVHGMVDDLVVTG
jgi:hypothetical protein